VDPAGAERLRWRIEQQQHWRQATAVLDGRQSPTDPDLDALETVRTGLRLYSGRMTRRGTVRICKRLVEGVWEYGTYDESFAPNTASARVMAHVA
jgi:hypothetical protein